MERQASDKIRSSAQEPACRSSEEGAGNAAYPPPFGMPDDPTYDEAAQQTRKLQKMKECHVPARLWKRPELPPRLSVGPDGDQGMRFGLTLRSEPPSHCTA